MTGVTTTVQYITEVAFIPYFLQGRIYNFFLPRTLDSIDKCPAPENQPPKGQQPLHEEPPKGQQPQRSNNFLFQSKKDLH